MRLSCAIVMPYGINTNVAASVNLDAFDASCFVCHRLFESGDNSWDMVARLRLFKCFLKYLLFNRMCNARLCWLLLGLTMHICAVVGKWVTLLTCQMVIKLFYLTGLETRTKESNACAS